MTRDEHRAKCIITVAMNLAIIYGGHADRWKDFEEEAIIILDSLHGIARVNPIEATEEMVSIAGGISHNTIDEDKEMWRAMAARADLTNPPETTQ